MSLESVTTTSSCDLKIGKKEGGRAMQYRRHKDPSLVETEQIGRRLKGTSVTQLLGQLRDGEKLFLLVRRTVRNHLEAVLLPRSLEEIEIVKAELMAVPGTTVVGFWALPLEELRRLIK